MSQEAARAFFETANQRRDLEQLVEAAFASAMPKVEIVRLGRENGFDFTADEAKQVLQGSASGELADESLEQLSGGLLRTKNWVLW